MIYYVTVESDSFVSTNFDNCDGTYLLLIRKLKVHMQHYANEPLLQVRLSFQKLLQIHLTCRNNKMFWEMSDDAYLLIRVQTMLNHISHFISHFTFFCFLTQNQCQKSFLRARAEKGIYCVTLQLACLTGLLLYK